EAESHEHARDGSDRFFLNNLIGIVENGAISRAWGTQRDITERKRADQALRQNREQLQVALKAARMATWSWDLLSDARIWDQGASALVGISERNSDGQLRSFLSQVHPDDRDRVSDAMTSAVEGTGQYREEYRIISSDGAVHWLTDQGE